MLPEKDFIQDGLQVLCWAPVDCVQVGCMSQRLRMARQPSFLFPAFKKGPVCTPIFA